MPIYEYKCQACHEQLEILQKMADAPLVECPQCGEPALKKKVSAAAFRLKGSGWYETDFKTGDKKKNLVGGSESAGGGSNAPASGSGDSKSSESKANSGKPSDSKSGDSKKTA